MRILAVDDDPCITSLLRISLSDEGYAVDVADSGEECESLTESYPYDLIILDLMLSDKDGILVCQSLRRKGIKTPVLILTARKDTIEQVQGLDSGADDYLVKPFEIQILCARIRALLRRKAEIMENRIQAGGLILDTVSKQVWNSSQEVLLTAKEYSILAYLMAHPNSVVSRTELEQHIWDLSLDTISNVVEQHIKNLRAKLGAENRQIIQTVRGSGYKLVK